MPDRFQVQTSRVGTYVLKDRASNTDLRVGDCCNLLNTLNNIGLVPFSDNGGVITATEVLERMKQKAAENDPKFRKIQIELEAILEESTKRMCQIMYDVLTRQKEEKDAE